MDELWQRYRSFWVPVLIGLGVFLVGLIAVHILTEDPESLNARVRTQAGDVGRLIEPTRDQEKNVPANAEMLRARVLDWSKRLDQAAVGDPLEAAVDQALIAAVLRGVTPDVLRAAAAAPDTAASAAALAPFEGDAVLAGRALQRYEAVRQDRLVLLRTGDPNVGFSRLLNDVWYELKMRANRADVDVKPDVLGFGSMTSVTRAALEQRLLNLGLVAELADLAIRSGVRSIDEIRIDPRADVEVAESFLRMWPVTLTFQGDMVALQPLLDRLTVTTRPLPLTSTVLTLPPRSSALEGVVQLSVTAASTLVRPDVSLDLDTEDQRQ